MIKKIKNVLSLFNGMSFGKMALEGLGVEVDNYYSSEIDKYANQATQAMFPDTIQLGDILDWRDWDIDWSSIDLVTGGFPCQAWSVAGNQLGDKDERGMLFWTMLDIIKHVKWANPKADFLIENVKMKKEFEAYITTHTEKALGHVHKILINSALVSAQNRNRYYWTNFKVEQPGDKGILLKDIIESEGYEGCIKSHGNWKQKKEKSQCLDANYHKGPDNHGQRTMLRPCKPRKTAPADSAICHHVANATDINGNESNKRIYAETGKAPTLTTMGGGHREPKVYCENLQYRKLTPRECFRLQTVPEHHIDTLLTAGISNTQLYKMCGNGWTMEVIKHILKRAQS